MEFIREHRRLFRSLAVLGGVGMLFLLYWFLRPDPNVARAKELQERLARPDLPSAERLETWDSLRQAMQRLTPEQRWELGQAQRERREAEMDRYFELSPKEKAAFLDAQIDRMQKWRTAANANGAGGPPAGFRPPAGGDRDERMRNRLDHTTPEQRAQWAQFRKDMQARMAQRGISSFGFGRRLEHG